MKKGYPIPRTRPHDAAITHDLEIPDQGKIPYARTVEVATPSVGKGAPSKRMDARGQGAMVSPKSFTIR